jgi:hypothetical protein
MSSKETFLALKSKALQALPALIQLLQTQTSMLTANQTVSNSTYSLLSPDSLLLRMLLLDESLSKLVHLSNLIFMVLQILQDKYIIR